jgi:hypothetical protein
LNPRRLPFSLALAVALAAAAGCDSDPVTAPTDTEPVAITETFPPDLGRLTPNGGITHPFAVQRPGTISAVLTTLTPAGNPVGLMLGTWNGSSCATGQLNARDAAIQGESVVGNATATGNYCVRIYDAAGSLTAPVEYQITVTHF